MGDHSYCINNAVTLKCGVFLITLSLHPQVIEGAAKILATTLARREKPLYNYVLVPFHDPSK